MSNAMKLLSLLFQPAQRSYVSIQTLPDKGKKAHMRLIFKAGLALGAPVAFHDLSVSDILTMNNTNTNGPMSVTHAVLNASMVARKAGTILTLLQ